MEYPRQFTTGDQHDGSGRWSPDGSQIAFLSDRGDKEKPAQIYLIPFSGGEASRLTQIDGEIDDLSWSPDGKQLLCTVRKMDAETLEREKDEQKKKLGVVSRHYDRLFYKLDGYGYLPHERTHIWTVDARTGKAKQLTDDPVYDEHFSHLVTGWKMDRIQFPTAARILISSPTDWICSSCQQEGGKFRKIETPMGDKFQPSFSPDGKLDRLYRLRGRGVMVQECGLVGCASRWI